MMLAVFCEPVGQLSELCSRFIGQLAQITNIEVNGL